MSAAEERMQNEIDELEQENRLLRARNDRLEAELKAVPVLSAGPITSEMANWSAEDKAELVAAIAKHTVPVQERKPVCWDGEEKCPNRQACCDAQHCLYTAPPAAQPAPVQSCYCQNCEAMGKELAALKDQSARPQEPTIEDNSQDWAGMDGATAWHLIDRHADGWSDVAKMMAEWLAANTPTAVRPAPVQEPVAWANPNDLKNFDMKVRTNGGPLHTLPLCLCTPPAAQRQWVGLTDEQKLSLEIQGGKSDVMLAELIESWLKEKNT
jgi:hypothetical protein